MRVMALREFGKPLEEMIMADPVPSPDEVVLAVTACGVCGTDLKIVHGTQPTSRKATLPLVPGHEIAGIVETVGCNVRDWQPGERAVVSFHVGCGVCRFCQAGQEQLCLDLKQMIGFTVNGGYAEKVKVPARNLVKISKGISDEEAAIIPDAVATAVHAVADRGKVEAGDRVLIIGAGGLGIHALQMACLIGAYTIVVEIDARKRELARQFGAEEIYTTLEEMPLEVIAHTIIETSGGISDYKGLTGRLEKRGILVIVGYQVGKLLDVEILEISRKELTIIGSKASSRNDLIMAVDLVEKAKIKPVVRDAFSLAQANEVLGKLEGGEFIGRSVLIP